MTQFIALNEQGDGSVHFINLLHLIQVIHVPNSPVATVTTTDGKSFRIAEAEYLRLSQMMMSGHQHVPGAPPLPAQKAAAAGPAA